MKIFSPIAAITALIFATTSMQGQVVWTNSMDQPNTGAYTGTAADISTNGMFVAAVTENYSNESELVGDTTFDVVDDTHITGLGNGGADGSDFFGPYTDSNPAPTNYQEAVNGCAYTYTGSPAITFHLTGLKNNELYQVEIWDVDNDSSRETEYSSTGPGGTTSVDVENGFVIGTFATTASSTSQAISFQGVVPHGGAGEINAVALRDLGAVPEPSTYAMLFAGVGALVLVARLRRRA
jgi:hypothetical protein